ncbi:hypothetical protein NQ315_003724 [Exocentrus adspersus]|uniref:Uncharacterized protein n=1 Tax=Exocentrus adspersus TaxID=1586481 RepID=A0AAV8V654_9CUCU|nr:hypothetical protein NQ315_003724 [Exocentrus adspersus]
MLKLSQIIVNSSKNLTRSPKVIWFNNLSSSSPTVELKSVQNNTTGESYIVDNAKAAAEQTVSRFRTSSPMVAAAFASLQSGHSLQDIKTPFTDEKIIKANTIDELLSISEGSGVSRRHALKVVSVLADWCTLGKVKLADFETDPRFIRLCRILTKGVGISKNKNVMSSRSEDLSTILSVTADDEAAKLVGNITVSQMVKVMATLSQKRRRSTLLLEHWHTISQQAQID